MTLQDAESPVACLGLVEWSARPYAANFLRLFANTQGIAAAVAA